MGRPDDAIDEVLRLKRQERQELKDQMQSRKSTKALLRTAFGAREQAVIKLEGPQKEEVDLTQLVLLKQQENVDAKNDAAEKEREVEMLQAKRLAEVDCDGSVSHGSSASFSSPRSPQQWALGLVTSLPEDVRVKFEDWCSNADFEAKASVDPYSEVLSQVSPAIRQDADPVSPTSIATISVGSNFRAATASFPSPRAAPYVAGFQMSKSQERLPGVEKTSNVAAVTLTEALFQERARTQARACHGWRGRGLMKGLRPEILDQSSSWQSAQAHGSEACTQ